MHRQYRSPLRLEPHVIITVMRERADTRTECSQYFELMRSTSTRTRIIRILQEGWPMSIFAKEHMVADDKQASLCIPMGVNI